MRIPGKHNTPDVLERNEGTVFVFCPLTDRARAWIDESVQPEPWQSFGSACRRSPTRLGASVGMQVAGFS